MDSCLCLSERCMLLMFLTDSGWLDGYLYELVSEFKACLSHSFSTWRYQMGLKVLHVKPTAPSHCINFIHCIQCATCTHQKGMWFSVSTGIPQTCHLHQLPDSLLCHGRWCFHLYFFGGEHDVFKHVKCQIVSFISLSDAKGFVCSCIQYKTFSKSCIHRCAEACENIFNT